jgi:cytochrome c oxidase subunit IV
MGAPVSHPSSQADSHPAAAHAPHVLSPGVLLGTAGALLVLTVLTVTVSRVGLGQWNVVVALAVACSKAALVALFFMHLKYENGFLRVVLVSAALFAVLFIAFVIFDTHQYQPSLREAAEHPAATRR